MPPLPLQPRPGTGPAEMATGQPEPPVIRPLEPSDALWVRRLLEREWGSTVVVSRGRTRDAAALPGFVALLDGERCGLVTYEQREGECEVVTLNSLRPGRGVGRALLAAVIRIARRQCGRLWLVTTNDNLHALRFYQRAGWDLAALHRGAVDDARRLKPEIPTHGDLGIPIRHELELEYPLDR